MTDIRKDSVTFITVDENGADQRLDNYLTRLLKGVPKTHVYRLLRTGHEVLVWNRTRDKADALVEALLKPGTANDRLLATPIPANRAGDRHPLLMVMATRFLLPFALMIGVFLYLRGHNLPGGGFVAGLVFSIALVMQYLASGLGWTAARQRYDFHAVIGAGEADDGDIVPLAA